MELGDCGYDDSDVLLDHGISAVGRVDSLLPRFDQAQDEGAEGQTRSSSNKRSTSN